MSTLQNCELNGWQTMFAIERFREPDEEIRVPVSLLCLLVEHAVVELNSGNYWKGNPLHDDIDMLKRAVAGSDNVHLPRIHVLRMLHMAGASALPEAYAVV